MKVTVVCLVYGNRPHDTIYSNLARMGAEANYVFIDREGIANALNDGLDLMEEHGSDAVAYLANDILEPDNWLAKKIEAIQTYPSAGVVASSLDCSRTAITNEMVISNWLVPRQTFEKIGYFCESMFPYGPIDLDYCQRCYAAGMSTYYVMDCLAIHNGQDATGTEYGWDKEVEVAKHWQKHNEESRLLMAGKMNPYKGRL